MDICSELLTLRDKTLFLDLHFNVYTVYNVDCAFVLKIIWVLFVLCPIFSGPATKAFNPPPPPP